MPRDTVNSFRSRWQSRSPEGLRYFHEYLPERAAPTSHDVIQPSSFIDRTNLAIWRWPARCAVGCPGHADSRWFEQPVHLYRMLKRLGTNQSPRGFDHIANRLPKP
jgi:hypothetical protein